jgi:hypothetical protein
MTNVKRQVLVASVVAFCALGRPATVGAATSADMAAAEALFQEARDLMAQGRFRDACPKLAESQRLDPAVGTLLYLAECYEKNGLTASAWATFELAAAEGRKDKQAEREILAKERAQQLLPRLSRISIFVPDNARLDGLVVTNDGAVIGAASWGSALPVDPGKHIVQASAPGKKPFTTDVNVGENAGTIQVQIPLLQGEPQAVAVKPEAIIPPLAQPAPPPAVESTPESYWGTQRIIGLSLAGAGLLGLGVGTAFAVSAQGKQSDSEKYCAPDDKTRCTQQGVDMIDSAKRQNTLGNALIGVGGALIVGGAVVFFTAPSGAENRAGTLATRRLNFDPVVSSSGGAFLVSGRF